MRRALARAVLVVLIAPWIAVAALGDDTDADGVEDAEDNCLLIPNAGALACDSDMDGYGNLCDGDFNNDGVVNFSVDFALLFFPDFYDPAFGAPPPGVPVPVSACLGFDCDPPNLPGVTNVPGDGTNMDCSPDGSVNAADYALFFESLNFGLPGPSGLACAAVIPCP
jgi:hypothetical protein